MTKPQPLFRLPPRRKIEENHLAKGGSAITATAVVAEAADTPEE